MGEYYLPDICLKGLRACVNCSLLKTFQEFCNEGCDNCEKYFKFKDDPDRIIMFSTINFEAVVGLTDANRSWACRIKNVDTLRVGPYALYVFAKVPANVLMAVVDSFAVIDGTSGN